MEVSRADLAFSAVGQRYHITPPSIQPDLYPLPCGGLLAPKPIGKHAQIPARLGIGVAEDIENCSQIWISEWYLGLASGVTGDP